MADDQLFYVGQKVIIEHDGRVLVLDRNPLGADLPGGKIQIGEFDFVASLKREVKEETGLDIVVGMPIATGYFRFHPDVLKEKIKASELIYIVFYSVTSFSGEVQLSDEHESFTWVSKDDSKDLDDSRGLLKEVLKEYFNNKK